MPYASSIQTINDANGTAYAFLEDNGLLWQCQWNAEAQRWDQGQVVPGAFGGDKLQALYLDNLWPTSDSSGSNLGTAPAVVLAWRVGDGSSSQVLATFGRWDSDGQLQWSAPEVLSAPGVEVQQFALVPGDTNIGAGHGQALSLVVQAQQAGSSTTAILDQLKGASESEQQALLEKLANADRPDSDLYTNSFRLAGADAPALETLQSISTGSSGTTYGWSTGNTLSPAVQEAAPASPAPLLGGNTQLSRQALVAGTPSTGGLTAASVAGPGSDSAAPGSIWNLPTAYSGQKGNFRAGVLIGQAPTRWQFSNNSFSKENVGGGPASLLGFDDSIFRFNVTNKLDILWSGSFATTSNIGGNPFEYSYARLTIGKGKDSGYSDVDPDKDRKFLTKLRKGVSDVDVFQETKWAIGAGGSLDTRYNFAKPNTIGTYTGLAGSNPIVSASGRVSAGLNGNYKWVDRTETNTTIHFNAAAAFGWAWTQYASNMDGLQPPIPLIADLSSYATYLKYTGTAFDFSGKVSKDANAFGNNGIYLQGSKPWNLAAGVLGSLIALEGPVELQVQADKGFPNQATSPTQYSSANGIQEKIGLSGGYLWHGLVGGRLTIGGLFDQYFSDINGESNSNTVYFGLAALFPLGISVPLLSYSVTWPNSGQPAPPGSGATPNASGNGDAYPFGYSPASASNSYFAAGPPSGSDINPSLLGSDQALQLFMLSAYSGAINLPDSSPSERTAPVTLFNAGSGLKNGSYSDVPLMAVGLDGGTEAFAAASFTVQNGSIVANTLQITQGGNALALPESSSGSGIYALLLDVFSSGIASPPSSAAVNPFSNLPLITVDSTMAGTPLQTQAIQRVWSVPVDPLAQQQSQQQAGVIYPVYNANTDQSSPPPANNNGAYSYTNVPVKLLSSSSSDTVPVPLLNAAVTATVLLSNGVIQAVELNEALLFALPPSGSSTSVQLILPSAVTANLPSSAATPSFAVTPQALAFNNLVADEQFSAQAGAPDSGVYLSAGVNDALPLLPQMGAWPVQNRVIYVTRGANGEISSSILNGQQRIGAGTAPIAELNPPSLEELYDNPSLIFSAASRPTAATIAGPTSATYSNDTFVAWVEASDAVVPITSSDGSANYQAYMQALYGKQRINYRLQTGNEWEAPALADLYAPEGAVITELQTFNVANPAAPGGSSTLLVWSELAIDAIQGTVADVGAGAAIPAVIKAGFINPNARSLEWNDLFSDANGQSIIQTIPWDPSTDVGLTIEDISVASQPLLLADGSLAESPLVSWSQRVRTPYRQSVLNDEPGIYLELGALQTGLNSINLGTIQEPSTTATLASSTGLNFALPGALPKSQAAAVQNIDGTGVLSTGLGSLNGPRLQLARSIPTAVSVFSGSISGTTLSVTSLAAGRPQLGDGLSGAGVLAGTTITGLISVDAVTGLGTYAVNQSQSVAVATLQALPQPAGLLSFSGSIEATTLSVTALPQGSLKVGDGLAGQGIEPGTRITAVLSAFETSTGQGSYSVDRSQSLVNSALVAVPPAPSAPYTLEFWAQLQPDSNPNGAGLVALGQPSAGAIGPAELPEGWLLGASFVVDRITYQQAVSTGLIEAIPSGTDSTALYGWAWAVVATGADTTAMGGNGGSNLYSNALQINNLVSGVTLEGVNKFLNNYGVSASELIGLNGSTAATLASVPFTELQFNTFLDGGNSNLPTSNLNGIAVDTNTAAMNGGLLEASDVETNVNLNTLFNTLWAYQQQTGEAKVSFNLAPGSSNATTTPSASSNEQYSGYKLDFALLNGPAVSVNGLGQLVFDVAPGLSLTSSTGVDLRDGQWHYIAATYLPQYEQSTVNGEPVTLPTLQGSASLLVDGEVVTSNSGVSAAYAAQNLSDQALLLANNAGGGLDQLAIYDKALTNAVPPPGVAGVWPQISSDDALAAIAVLGLPLTGQSSNGTIPGAISEHWAARNVNPNDALLATYTASFDASSNSWSPAALLNPQLAPQPTTPSAVAPGSLQNDLVIAVPSSSWISSDWNKSNGSSTDGFFNPANQQLKTVTVQLTGTSTSTLITLNPDQVLLGGQTLQALQPLANGTSLNYTVLSDSPAFSLLIPADQIKNPADSYTATYTFQFADGSSVSNVTPVPVNAFASSVASSGLSSSTVQSRLTNRSKALATAQVLEQAPLQMQYIDSGEVFQSRPTAATTSSKALSNTPETFGQSQVFGSFTDSSGNTNGWLAIAQPSSLNASSDPAGRVWIQYTGQSKGGVPSSDPAQAPSTWLNALANSNFSPDTPNLPLLGDAFYPSSSGGLLIQADPTAGWGQQLGQTMLVVDVNNDGTQDLVIAAPAANGGGVVYIVDGNWIQGDLANDTGSTILNLSNPTALGSYITILKPESGTIAADGSGFDTSVAGFGTALAFDGTNLWIGAPNVLQLLNPSNTTTPGQSLVPIGAIYSYSSSSGGWNSGTPTPLTPTYTGTGGTAITPDPTGAASTEYWGSQLGSAIAISSGGQIAFSAPGVVASLEYSGTQQAQQQASGQTSNKDAAYGDGALLKIQLPSVANNNSVSTTQGINNPGLVPVTIQGADVKAKSSLAETESAYMQNLKALQSVNIADATVYYNQALQALPVGAVYLFNSSSDLPSSGNSITAGGNGTATFYGAQPWNALGPSGFGSSLAFADLVNKSGTPMLAIGADQAGGSGAVYLVDTSQSFTDSSGWVTDINLGSNQYLNQYLCYLASSFTLYGAADADNFGNGLVNLGDVNGDGYGDLLIQAFNASMGAGNGYVLFGSDQYTSTSSITTKTSGTLTINTPASGNVAAATIGQMTRADGSTFTASLLNELGDGPSAFTGLGSFGPGDVNGDGLPDILLGAGGDASAYLTYGQSYLESISNLQLQKLTSNTGYRLEGLASTTQGSLRAIGDFNDDGYGDFISIQPGDFYTTVRLELGANTEEILADYLYEYYSFTVGNGTEVLGAGDINGDGYADIAMFLEQNLSSVADGNGGAGSTTGILYGRSSDQLPIGSGFGLQAPVDASSNPLATLPSVVIGDSLTAAAPYTAGAPTLIADGDTIYAVVAGKPTALSDTVSLYFAQSRDGGNSWSDWIVISADWSTQPTFFNPSLAFFDQKLYLAYRGPFASATGAPPVITSWDPYSSAPWSMPIALSSDTATFGSDAFGMLGSPSLLNLGTSLAISWVNPSFETVFFSASTAPGASGSWQAPTELQQRTTAANGTVSFVPIQATNGISSALLGEVPVLAVQNYDLIDIYSPAASGQSWELTSSLPDALYDLSTGISLTSTPTGLALAYNATSGISLQRLDVLSSDGSLIPTDKLSWQGIQLNGLSNSEPPSLVNANGALLLGSAVVNGPIQLNAIPALSNPGSTTWLNSSVQLPDGQGGWTLQQQSGGSSGLTASQTGSSLSPVGDLNNDGYADLLVSANNLLLNPGSDPASATPATGLRVISGAASSSQLMAANDATASNQTVQVAPGFGSSSSTPVASLSGSPRSPGSLQFTLTATDNGGAQPSSLTGSLTTSGQLQASADDLASAQQLFSPTQPPAAGSLGLGLGFGDLALNTTGTYGDLNADGYLDFLEELPTSVYGALGLGWDVWSIRAAGDVNGNGTDDVMLSLVPPETVLNDAPQWIQTVLVDGALFEVDIATNSFSFSAMRAPLDPYGRLQLQDLDATSSAQSWPLLQNWITPILSFQPASGSSSATIATSSPASTSLPGLTGGAAQQATVAAAYGSSGEILLISGSMTANGVDQTGFPIIQISRVGADGTSTQWTAGIPGEVLGRANSGSSSDPHYFQLSPSGAAIFDGYLYLALSSAPYLVSVSGETLPEDDGEMYLFSIKESDLTPDGVEDLSKWNQYQLPGLTSLQPALVNEESQLALYFVSDNQSKNILVSRSSDPQDSASWDGSGTLLQWTNPNDTAPNIQINSGGASPQTGNIAATRFHALTPTGDLVNRTYLAFCMNTNGGSDDDQVFIVEQPDDANGEWSASQAFNAQPGIIYLSANSSQLALVTTNLTGTNNPFGVTLYNAIDATPASATLQAGANATVVGASTIGGQLILQTQSTQFFGSSIALQPVATPWATASQQSLAGTSIDGNIDVNGDGFMDMLVSDPSNPAAGLANQYVLFGGDYLNIASQVGTPGNDVMLGTPLADVIYSIQGADQVFSNGGKDVIYTGAGDDVISIKDNAFIRIDAGSGFDALQLEGLADQNYDFRLNLPSPEYFAGTKLRGIELISSIDYGANQLSFDAAAINAINTDRVLFLTPDPSDSINLSTEFNRNASFDTSSGGTLWNAYAAAPATATPATANLALVYVATPTGQTAGWLSTNVSLTDTPAAAPGSALRAAASPAGTAASDPPSFLPTTSPIADTQAFGDGITLVAYSTGPSTGVARFAIERSDPSKRQVVLYASSSANASAEPGSHYTAVAGLVVFEPGQISHEVTVPIDSAAMAALRGGSLSLEVEELKEAGQQQLHLLITPVAAAKTAGGDTPPPPGLSGFELVPTADGMGATLRLRADSNGSTQALDHLKLTVSQRAIANSFAVVSSQTVTLLDAIHDDDETPPAYDAAPGALALDNDQRHNAQISAQLVLSFTAQGGQASVSLAAPELQWQSALELEPDFTLRFTNGLPFTLWRADSGNTPVNFELQGGGKTLTLMRDAFGGNTGSITPQIALDADPLTGWLASEGLRVGSLSVVDASPLVGSTWTPTATSNGQQLELLGLSQEGNQITANFAGGVSAVYGLQSTGSAPTPTAIRPQVDVQRLAGYDNAIGFYAIDAITGTVDGVSPGDAGYLQKALARSEVSGLLLSANQLPAYGASKSYTELPLDSNKNYGALLLVNGDRSNIYSSFSAANPGGSVQMINLGTTKTGLVLGFEDLAAKSGDGDYNDLVVGITNVSVSLL